MLTGVFRDGRQRPLTGTIQFTPVNPQSSNGQIVVDRPVVVPVTDGTFSVDLIPSGSAHWSHGKPVPYRVEENIGGVRDTYVILVPDEDADISDLLPLA